MDILDEKFRCVKLERSLTYAECICEQRSLNPVCQKCITGKENIEHAERGLGMGRKPGRSKNKTADADGTVREVQKVEKKIPLRDSVRKVYFTLKPELIQKIEVLAKKNFRTFSEQILWIIDQYED